MRVVEPSCEYEIELGESVGRGGEGEVLRVLGRSDIVAKVIHQERRSDSGSRQRQAKLISQIQARPQSRFLCWPSGLLFDDDDNWLGFVMPAVGVNALPWASFSNLSSRMAQAPEFDLKYALAALRNLCNAFEIIHATGGVVGDVNESNVLVGADASVWVIDCDSQQFSLNGDNWFCTVGKEEFCAPELVGADFKTTPRTASSDVFGLAVLAFQMLSGGSHPFDAVSKDLNRELDPLPVRIKSGLAPLLVKTPGLSAPPRVPLGAIPRDVLDLIRDSLLSLPHLRPTLATWAEVLFKTEMSLKECKKVESHMHLTGTSCPWCRHARATGVDIWPSRSDQRTLPPIDLKSRKDVQVQRIRPEATSGQDNKQSVSFRSYLGLFLAHPAVAVRFFWRKVPLARYLMPPSPAGTSPSPKSAFLLVASLFIALSPVALLWVFAPSGRLGLAIVLARPALAVFTIAGVVFYLVSCTRQSRIRLFALTLADLWRLPSLALFSGVFWLSVLLLVLLDALYRLLRFIHWLWRSN